MASTKPCPVGVSREHQVGVHAMGQLLMKAIFTHVQSERERGGFSFSQCDQAIAWRAVSHVEELLQLRTAAAQARFVLGAVFHWKLYLTEVRSSMIRWSEASMGVYEK